MTETVPADIAAAIQHVIALASAHGRAPPADRLVLTKPFVMALGDLETVILHHLRGYAEMKAALERIEQGV